MSKGRTSSSTTAFPRRCRSASSAWPRARSFECRRARRDQPHRRAGGAKGNENHSGRLRRSCGPGRQPTGRQPGAAGWQYNGPVEYGARSHGEAPRIPDPRRAGPSAHRADRERQRYGRVPAMAGSGVDGVVVTQDGLFFVTRQDIAFLALRHRLPSIVYSRETAEAGALASYGPDNQGIFRRTSVYVDRILKGASPSDFAVEQPTT